MSNPTILSEGFNGSLGAFTGAGPTQYLDGLLLETGATNLHVKPLSPDAFAYGHLTLSEMTGQTIPHPYGGNSDRYRRATVTGVAGSNSQFGIQSALSSPTMGSLLTYGVLIRFSSERIGDTVFTSVAEAGGAMGTRFVSGVPLFVTGGWQFCTQTITLAQSDRNNSYLYISSTNTADQEIGSTFDTTFASAVLAPGPSSAIPSVDSSGTVLSGYSWSSTAHNSTSTRAASSASVTIAEPAAVACWYREGYSGAKTFAYLEPYGTLGTYGSIAYAAGDLTISTSRNLVIGPFAAFDRELTANEQANLRSTQNWSMNSVNGSNIILPLSGRRRPR